MAMKVIVFLLAAAAFVSAINGRTIVVHKSGADMEAEHFRPHFKPYPGFLGGYRGGAGGFGGFGGGFGKGGVGGGFGGWDGSSGRAGRGAGGIGSSKRGGGKSHAGSSGGDEIGAPGDYSDDGSSP
ncbi:glycine-rich protein DOT1-like [Salvia splendens]|uniref:glycine-rich protein DOT1-like n=1 Tax=Salvia splendens TaxID=180675 RepID=UPI001C27A854|nr:glycine-rich protein DOT1-like [Salvia splendens]